MIAHLLSPVLAEQRPSPESNLSSWGKNIRFPDAATADWTKIHIAIISSDDDFGKACRQRLYALAYPFKHLNIVDLGQVNGGELGLTEVISFLLSKHILPIVLGGNTYAILQAYEQNPVFCHYVSINNLLDYDSNQRDNNRAVLNRWAEQQPRLGLHYTNIGFQIHHAMPDTLDWLDRQGFEVFRLGKIRQNLEDVEPLVRDADLLATQLLKVVSPLKSPAAWFVMPA
jgi:formiminoglutamase